MRHGPINPGASCGASGTMSRKQSCPALQRSSLRNVFRIPKSKPTESQVTWPSTHHVDSVPGLGSEMKAASLQTWARFFPTAIATPASGWINVIPPLQIEILYQALPEVFYSISLSLDAMSENKDSAFCSAAFFVTSYRLLKST